jgi:hypothetical protein
MNDTYYQRFRVGPKLFIHAPPFLGRRSKETGEYLSKRLARIQPPFNGAKPWQHSVYYFWWEFLRRHEGYKDCCARGGAGRYKKLYADFGDVHAYETKDFWFWWTEKLDNDWKRGEFLFAEPAARRMAVQDRVLNTQTDDMLVVSIPLEVRTPQLVKNLRRLLDEHKTQVATARNKSRALYPIAASVRLSTLHQTLAVWDTWNEHKHRKKKYEQAELAGIYINRVVNGETVDGLKRADLPYSDVQQEVRRRQIMAFNRYLAAAEDYIENVGRGQFPLRNDGTKAPKRRMKRP